MLVDNISIVTVKGKGGKVTRHDKKFISSLMEALQAVLKHNEEKEMFQSAKEEEIEWTQIRNV